MSNLKKNLNDRIERMADGDGMGTDDPLMVNAMILLSRTLIDISENKSERVADVHVRNIEVGTDFEGRRHNKKVEDHLNNIYWSINGGNECMGELVPSGEAKKFVMFIGVLAVVMLTFVVLALLWIGSILMSYHVVAS